MRWPFGEAEQWITISLIVRGLGSGAVAGWGVLMARRFARAGDQVSP